MKQLIKPLKFLVKQLKKDVKHLKFWFKTALYYYTPGGYGYYRHLSKYRDPDYVPDRNKNPVTLKQDKESGWMEQHQGEVRYRNYETYEEYVMHQRHKFDVILKEGKSFRNYDVLWYRYLFYRRFRHLEAFLPKSARILCAGARQGTEVEVLHDLGFKNAYGIDLNPGPNNKLVRVGDFMHLENADSSLDMIYCNAIDHALNLEAFFAEHARVIKPDGYVLYDISLRKGSEFEAVEWESAEAVLFQMLHYFKTVIKVETEQDFKWILLQGKKSSS